MTSFTLHPLGRHRSQKSKNIKLDGKLTVNVKRPGVFNLASWHDWILSAAAKQFILVVDFGLEPQRAGSDITSICDLWSKTDNNKIKIWGMYSQLFSLLLIGGDLNQSQEGTIFVL